MLSLYSHQRYEWKREKEKLDRFKVKEYVYHHEKVKLEKQEHLYQISNGVTSQPNILGRYLDSHSHLFLWTKTTHNLALTNIHFKLNTIQEWFRKIE